MARLCRAFCFLRIAVSDLTQFIPMAIQNWQLNYPVTCPFPTLTCFSKHVRIRALAGVLACVADFSFADKSRSALMSLPLKGRWYAGLLA